MKIALSFDHPFIFSCIWSVCTWQRGQQAQQTHYNTATSEKRKNGQTFSKTIVKWIEIVTNYILHLKKSNFLKSKALSVVFTYCYCFNDLRIADVILRAENNVGD